MSSRDRLKRGSRRQILRLGVTIELTNYEQIETSTHGTRHEPTSDSPRQIPAIPDPDNESTFMYGFGTDAEYDVTFLIRDDDAGDNLTGGGSEEHSSRVSFEGATFDVETVNPYHDNGVYLLGCNTGDEP
jgi:hypothetical protein